MSINEELIQIDKRLSTLFPKNNDLYKELNEFLQSGSKRIRSKFALLYLKANNITVTDKIIAILSAGEIIHNASLLHDDILDNSFTRRGKDTVGKLFSQNLSILSGDYLLSTAVSMLLRLNNTSILDIFNNCIKKMIDAEFSQYFLRGEVPSLEKYLEICSGKTAELFSAMLECSLLIAKQDMRKAVQISKKFGLLFQIKNDISSISRENDIKNKKFSR